MPRVTRAALRSNTMLEDEADAAASVPLPSTPRKEREPLGEVTGNTKEDVVEEGSEMATKSKKKAAAKGKKANAAKKSKKQGPVTEEELALEVLEDDNQSATSSAVEEACEDLLKESTNGEFLLALVNPTIVDD